MTRKAIRKTSFLLIGLLCVIHCFAESLSTELSKALKTIVPSADNLIYVAPPVESASNKETDFSHYLKNTIEMILSESGKEIFDLNTNMESESFLAELFDSGYTIQDLDEREAPVGEISASFSAINNVVEIFLEYKSYLGNSKKTKISCSTKDLPGLKYDLELAQKEYTDSVNSKKTAIFGTETFYLPSGDVFESTENRTVKKFRELIQKNFGFTCVDIPGEFESYTDLKDYAETEKENIPVRYVVFCTTETEPETLGKKTWINARISFTMLDLWTGKEYISDEATSIPMSASMTTATDNQAKTKSRTAIDNACDPNKNPESLLFVMQKVINEIE